MVIQAGTGVEPLSIDPRILVIDDSETFCRLIETAFGNEYSLRFAHDERSAQAAAAQFNPHLILLDLHLPPDERSARIGLSLLRSYQESLPRTRIIVVSGTNETRDAMDAIAAGASDFYTKPIALDELRVVIKRNLQIVALEEENERLAAQMAAREGESRLIGSAPTFQRAISLVQRVAPTEATVLLIGENGTGKELFAREIHVRSNRSRGPFVAINCGAIPETLAEAELFGFAKGAFTGAVRDRIGRVQAADGGTLFLDEIGELSEHMQTKLLRFLQERQIEPLGDHRTIAVDTRIVAATNRDLRQMVEDSAFREDLYYRLNVIEIQLPSLRERITDIVPLANYFLRQNATLAGGRVPGLGNDAREWLEHYTFPGNVRELENLVKRAMLLATGPEIRASDFSDNVSAPAKGPRPPSFPPGADGQSLREVREGAEKAAIEHALALEGGNMSRAAERLQVERKSLQRIVQRLEIDVSRYCPDGQTRRGRPRRRAREA